LSNQELPVIAHPSATVPLTLAAIPETYSHPGLTLRQIWTILWAYRKVSIGIAAAVSALTAVVLLIVPRTYEATATVMVNYEINDPLNGKEFPVGLLGSYMATQVELLRNQELQLAVVDRLKLTENEDYTSGYGGNGTLRDYVQSQLAKKLSIYQGQYGSQLIYVTYGANDAVHAAQVANTVVEVFKEREFQRASSPAAERARRYAEQLEQLKEKVRVAQQQYTDFHRQNALIDTGDKKADMEVASLSELEQQLMTIQSARRTAEARRSNNPDVDDQVMGSQLIQTLRQQQAAQEAQLAQLRITLGARHPDLLQLQSQLAATRSRLATEVNRYASNASQGVDMTKQMEAKLRTAVAGQRDKVLSTSALYDQSAKYRLELESAQAVYKRALDGYDQVMFASAGKYSNIDFANRATVPVRAARPKRLAFMFLGMMAGCALGLIAPLIYELVNRRVRCRDDLERDEGVPVLAEFGPLPLLGGTT
jgi:polysaccharide biosynthesis transport protein